MSKYLSLAALLAPAALADYANPVSHKSDVYAGIVKFGHDIVGASADITVPECKVGRPKDPYSNYISNGWVGISAYPDPPSNVTDEDYGLLQTGITCFVNRYYHYMNNTFTQDIVYKAWYEWAPNPPVYFKESIGDIQPGDIIHGEVHAHGRNAGSSYLRNMRTGKEYTHKFVNQTYPLYNTNAEWITECETGYSEQNGVDGTLTATYDKWCFDNAMYNTADGRKHKSHKSGADEYIDTYINGTLVAKTEYIAPGRLAVHDVWPKNLTLGVVQ